ncbi:cytochrome P450 [Actinomadura macrotermitis]|uniref:Polyketide biosynthesis cytochrome P450 PksS n=1 Tax=Actinomadura macrotermitis TaxID=2585200 RepID=A0A7K0BXN2_9ACTN|nr:cytochrome P450 [Actinomadura macrotermitis]MQY05947.1 Polyketide biosynthesis cytochrome P450 PksS [Actinomadura macrotermitis]
MTENLYDPWSSEFVADPYPAFERLRETDPVFFHEPTGQWVISRYADVDVLLRDRRLGRSYLHLATHEEFGQTAEPEFLRPFWDLVRAGMLDVEPPVHTRLRRLVAKAFTARMVEGLRPMVRSLAEELAGGLAARGGGDLLAEVAEPLPVNVIAEMLGVPASDRALLRPWSADICGMYELNPSREAQETAVRAAVEFSAYLRELARARRADPRDDLISALAQVADEGDRLTEDELVGTCVLLLNAGHEATVNATGNGWWALFRNPGELARLRADHALVPTAVEEMLRYDTPAPMFERWVLADIEVAGVHIPKGAEVALQFASANRDPKVFPAPARMDVARDPNPHISFGLGIHYCLGAPLARIEMAESLGALLRAAPGMRLAAEPKWKPGYVLRGLQGLDVEI